MLALRVKCSGPVNSETCGLAIIYFDILKVKNS